MVINEFKMTVDSRSVNESFSRVAVSAFASQLDMTIEELGDIKTIVSEAVTNCIVHAYKEKIGKIYIFPVNICRQTVHIKFFIIRNDIINFFYDSFRIQNRIPQKRTAFPS